MEISNEAYHWELEGVYHALPSCPTGRRIPAELRRRGRGGRIEMCSACEARVEAAWDRHSQSLELQPPIVFDREMDDPREAMLRPEFHDRYPGVGPDRWYPAGQLAETVTEQCRPGELPWESGSRVLPNGHFLFRGGRPRRNSEARTRRSDRLHAVPLPSDRLD